MWNPLLRIGLIFAFSLLLLPGMVRATHIVGGEMNYTCLGNNEYEITLTIFRDCFNGNPNAWFDNPASIGVFNSDNELLEQILLPLMNNDTLDPVLTSECLVVPPNVCVHTTTYRTIVTLPIIAGGYQLAYQRCCRNETIVNIVDPLDTGATYGVTISEAALEACNSNPKFKEWPPIYICVNEPIVFDQSAIDQDGDSIVYRLCTPLTGATPDLPQPQPPNNPPYDEIQWIDPPYNVDNMLNGSPGGASLQINAQSGLLTGFPVTQGQFVVGICVEEYRDGVLISTTRRDFQYNIGLCGEANAAFTAPEVQCGSLTVNFENQSQGASNYLWQFNDPGNPGASSALSNPVYTFSDTGQYSVLLIVAPGAVCEDTAFQEINLQPNSLIPDFDLSIEGCSDIAELQVFDNSQDTLYDIATWAWEVNPGDLSSTATAPTFQLQETGTYTVNLTLTSTEGCTDTLSQTIDIELLTDALTAEFYDVCPGDSVALNADFNPAYEYTWAASPDIENPSVPNPVVQPATSTTYAVTVSDVTGNCNLETTVTVNVAPPLTPELPADTAICADTILLQVSAPGATTYFWYADGAFSEPLGTGPVLEAIPMGPTPYYVLVRDSFGCVALDSVQVDGNAIDILITSQGGICPGALGAAAVINQDPTDTLTYAWSPDSLIVFDNNSPTVFVAPQVPGAYGLTVQIDNQFGCTLVDSTTLTLIDTLPQEAFQSVQQCSGYTVQFSSSSVNAPFYDWYFGDMENPNASAQGEMVSYTYSGPGTYEVSVVLDNFAACTDTIVQTITVGEPQIDPAFTYTITECTDSVTVQLQDASVNSQSDITEWFWDLGNGQTATGPVAELVFTEDGTVEVRLIITSADGCVDEVTQVITAVVPDPLLPDTLFACPGQPLSLNPNPLPGYTYSWSPALGLSNPEIPNPVATLTGDQVYNVVLNENDGICTFERELTVRVAPPIEYELSNDTLVCGESLALNVFSPQAASYAWSEDVDFSTVLGSSPELTVAPSGPQTYYVTIKDSLGCTVLDSVQAEISNIIVFSDGTVGVCEGDTATLEVVELAAGQNLFYDWAPDNGILTGQGTAQVTVDSEEATNYEVMVTNGLGCVETLIFEVTVSSSIPLLAVTAMPDTIFQPELVQLLATQNAGYTYEWLPPDGISNPGVFNPQVLVDTTRSFTVRVTDKNGCTNEGLVEVVLLSACLPPYIFVPNAFTPDGDGLNDRLLVHGSTIDELYFAIYDRWGERVYETYDPQHDGWDGTFRNRQLPADVYGYYLEVGCFNQETYQEKGNITLLR
jgi:gliding motility-associated-like protein